MSQPVAMIFGITGQDGAYLAHRLVGDGYEVHGVSRDAETTSLERLQRIGIAHAVRLHSGDLSDFRSIVELLSTLDPVEIYNLSGQSSVARSFEAPIETFNSISVAAINIAEYLRMLSKPVRYFQAVSSECFGNTDLPANEETPFKPRSPYAMAKAAAFWTGAIYREAYDLHMCSGILSNHESPLRGARFVTRKLLQAAVRISRGSKERLTLGNLDIERDWGWAPEYVDAIVRIIRADAPGDFVVATGETRSLRSLAEAVFSCLDLDMYDHVDFSQSLLRPSEISRSSLDPARAKATLGWTARSKMADVARQLVACELKGELGPLPWPPHNLKDAATSQD